MLSEMVSGYMGDHPRVGQGRRHQGSTNINSEIYDIKVKLLCLEMFHHFLHPQKFL